LSIRILTGFAQRSRVHSSLNPRDYNTGPRPDRPSFEDCPEYYDCRDVMADGSL